MSTKIHITLRGEAHGLDEGKISLDAFGAALQALLSAYRGTASAMLAKAVGNPNYGGHRLRDRAYELDLLLASQERGCLQMAWEAVEYRPPGTTVDLFEDLPARTAEQLVRDIEAEARGVATSRFARGLLTSMPDGISSQTYVAYVDDHEIARAEVGDFEIAELPRDLPVLERISGSIIAARFTPGEEQVSIRDRDSSRTHRLQVTKEQLDSVLSHREETIASAALRSTDGLRAIWIRRLEDVKVPGPDERLEHIMTRWGKVLEGLG